MLVFTSIYGVVDGFFVSNYAGKTAFAAVNFIMPVLMILGGVGFLFGTGGSALIAKIIGEGDRERANRIFSFLVYFSVACGVILSITGMIVIRPLAVLLGGEGDMLEYAVSYGRIILLALPAYVLQYEFQCLFATAGKPKLGLYVTVLAGLTNMILDAVFVAGLSLGVKGAAIATVLGQCVGGILPIIYFIMPNSGLLRLTKTSFEGRALVKIVVNGSSELVNNISMSLVSMLYNLQLLKYAGEDGIAAYGILMYVCFVFQAIFIGYSVGVAPVVSYHFGAKTEGELKSLLKKNLIIISVTALAMFLSAEIFSENISRVFAKDEALFEMTHHAFKIFSFSFLFCGFCIMGSSFFTALNSGLNSALISFLRTLVFQISALFIFPLIWGLNGIWASMVFAEALSTLVTVVLLILNRKKFGYWDDAAPARA